MATTKEDIEATAPDPDEDDLDDLDDVLDEFQPKPATATAAALPKPAGASSVAPGSSGPGRPSATEAAPEELEAQLQAGMADLISQLGDNPDMQKQFEAMMQELVAAGAAPTDAAAAEHVKQASAVAPGADQLAGAAQAQTRAKKEDSFQDTIRRTMERMQQSGDAVTAATSSSAGGAGAGLSEDELLQQMMKELGVGGEGGSEDFNQMLLSMMTQLTNKDILYEPMKELHDKFPAWLENNGASTPADDRRRYEEQARLVTEIVQRFERNGYSDDNDDDREYIVERMQKMQAAGSPPPDLVGDMSAAQEALGDLDAGCPTQ